MVARREGEALSLSGGGGGGIFPQWEGQTGRRRVPQYDKTPATSPLEGSSHCLASVIHSSMSWDGEEEEEGSGRCDVKAS